MSDPIIKPIGTFTNEERDLPKRSLARDIDWFVCAVAALTALATFGLSAYFFYGFTQTDTGFWTLASSLALCFGVGSLAYVPAAISAKVALNSARGILDGSAYGLAVILSLPWLLLSCVFIFASALPKIYGIIALIISALLLVWALSRLVKRPKLDKI